MNIQGWFFRVDWFGFLVVQGTLKNLLSTTIWKHHFFGASALFMVQLSHPYVITGKIIALISQPFVGQVMSLLFNILSRVVIAFLPRSKCLLISWLQSPSAVILEPKKIKSVSFHCLPIYLPWNDRTECHDLLFLNVEFSAKFFTLIFHFQFLFTFCLKSGVICIYEIIDISSGNLVSSFCFIQPGFSHDVLCK